MCLDLFRRKYKILNNEEIKTPQNTPQNSNEYNNKSKKAIHIHSYDDKYMNEYCMNEYCMNRYEYEYEYDLLEALEELRIDTSKNVFFHYGYRIDKNEIEKINYKLTRFSEDKNVVLIFDSCDLNIDLPYIATNFDTGFVKKKGELKAKIICLSGSRDKVYELSSTFYSILLKNENITWREMYEKINLEIVNKGSNQVAVLSASDPSLFNEIVEF